MAADGSLALLSTTPHSLIGSCVGFIPERLQLIVFVLIMERYHQNIPLHADDNSNDNDFTSITLLCDYCIL